MKKDQGSILRDKGMEQAINHADEVHKNWSTQAFSYLELYVKYINPAPSVGFMAEDVREAAQSILTDPPSARAWGGIFAKAARKKLIYRKGFAQVKNPKAHKTPATVWGAL